MRISWNFENGPSTYFDLIYKKERGTIESLLADKIDLPVENISEFLKNFLIPPDSDFDYYKSEIICSKLKSIDTASPITINQGLRWCHFLYS